MRSLRGQTGWLSHSIAVTAALLVAGLQFLIPPAWAGYELPPGERITNLPHIPRSMPNKESYEIYDPVIGRNFDIKNFWMRADLRVRPEWRTGVCFGGGAPAAGACNGFSGGQAGAANAGKSANDFYVQQWVRLGLGYDLSPDVNFYFEIIDSANWGSNGNPNNAGNAGDPLIHSCGQANNQGTVATGCRLGVRAAYVLVRNLAGIQGLSVKAGRQYVIFGNHSLFGHFDWANTGYSHDGIMFQYNTKAFESHLGWFRNSETDIPQHAPVGSGNANIAGCNNVGGTGTGGGGTCIAGQRGGTPDAGGDVDMFIFYNQLKTIPGLVFEPYYVLYLNMQSEQVNAAQGLGTAKHSNQIRHMIGQRTELRKGNWDFIAETAWQWGRMADGLCGQGQQTCSAAAASGVNAAGTGFTTPVTATQADNKRNVTINAWALRTWLGYTVYEHKWKPRLAFNLDYASGDGNSNCSWASTAQTGMACKTANTFENFFPTNHIHMAYADVQAWKNMLNPQVSLQFRPSERDHFEVWYMNMNVANARDNWYRAGQGPYVVSRQDNTKNHVGDEIDFSWTHMFADGNVALQATYAHIFTGGYLTNNLRGIGDPSQQSWGFVQLWMNF